LATDGHRVEGRQRRGDREIGEAHRLARQADPNFKMQDAGERAIRDWLVDILPAIGGPALVVYEDKRMPALIQREHLEEVAATATTHRERCAVRLLIN